MPTNPLTVELGQAIRDARIRKGLGPSELARLLRIAPSHLRQIEIGRFRPNVDLMERILDRLGPPNCEEPNSDLPATSAPPAAR